MLLSMTGYGEASHEGDDLRVNVQIRTVNNRFLRVVVKCSEQLPAVEAEVEREVRQRLSRGTVTVYVRLERTRVSTDYRLNTAVARQYLAQIAELSKECGLDGEPALEDVLALPGIVEEHSEDPTPTDREWPVIRETVGRALDQLNSMRNGEGRAMADELLSLCGQVADLVDRISGRAGQVVEQFRDKILERVRSLLESLDVDLDRADLIREVSIFADRSDISEELVRLRSHVDQFQAEIRADSGAGRKLDFLVQEMFRESNTIGSKANDVEIASHGVVLKETIEKMRELAQNVE